jgi:hypothetical protein
MAGVSFVSRGTNRGRRFCENCTSNYANQCILDPSVSVAFGAIIDDDEFALMRQMISFLRSVSVLFGHRPLSSYTTLSVGPLLGRSPRPTTRSRPLSTPGRDFIVDTAEQQNGCSSWLVVGDGDLSYSAELARTLSNNSTTNIRLIASVLEREETHQTVYRNSLVNSEAILAHGFASIRYQIDATKLETYFPPHSLRRIVFNFPHWRGKSNIRYNRKLVEDFIKSASKVLETNGLSEVHIALCKDQGGAEAATLKEWRGLSWMVPAYAASHGLLLRNIVDFQPDYDLSSRRGQDSPFFVGETPRKYVLGRPNGDKVDGAYQIAYCHELRLSLDPAILQSNLFTYEDLVHGRLVENLVQTCVPTGVRGELVSAAVIAPYQYKHPLLVNFIVYSGERVSLSRETADAIRAAVEAKALDVFRLDIEKPGLLVSRPFPYGLLPELMTNQQRDKERLGMAHKLGTIHDDVGSNTRHGAIDSDLCHSNVTR